MGEAGLGNNSRFFNRLKHHRSDHLADLWDEFSWFGRSPSAPRTTTEILDAFAQLEAVLIAVTNPGSNKQSGTFGDATQVFQVPHQLAEGDLDTKLGRLMAKLEEIEDLVTPPQEPKKRGRKPKALEIVDQVYSSAPVASRGPQRPSLRPQRDHFADGLLFASNASSQAPANALRALQMLAVSLGDDLEPLGLGEAGDGGSLSVNAEPRAALFASANPIVGDQRLGHGGDPLKNDARHAADLKAERAQTEKAIAAFSALAVRLDALAAQRTRRSWWWRLVG